MVNIENLENNFAERVCRFVPHMIDSIENYCNKFDYCKGKDLPKDFYYYEIGFMLYKTNKCTYKYFFRLFTVHFLVNEYSCN